MSDEEVQSIEQEQQDLTLTAGQVPAELPILEVRPIETDLMLKSREPEGEVRIEVAAEVRGRTDQEDAGSGDSASE